MNKRKTTLKKSPNRVQKLIISFQFAFQCGHQAVCSREPQYPKAPSPDLDLIPVRKPAPDDLTGPVGL